MILDLTLSTNNYCNNTFSYPYVLSSTSSNPLVVFNNDMINDYIQKSCEDFMKKLCANKGTSTKSDSNNTTYNKVSIGNTNFTKILTSSQRKELNHIKAIYKKNKDRYERIAARIKQETGKDFPAELICAIHYRESGCNFKTYLHNGQPLGKPTTMVPKGKCFDNFEDSAVDAIKMIDPKGIKAGDFQSYMYFAERYNGLGYRKRGIASPYVWSGTDKYTIGMYVVDGKFSATARDKRVGVAVIVQELSSIA